MQMFINANNWSLYRHYSSTININILQVLPHYCFHLIHFKRDFFWRFSCCGPSVTHTYCSKAQQEYWWSSIGATYFFSLKTNKVNAKVMFNIAWKPKNAYLRPSITDAVLSCQSCFCKGHLVKKQNKTCVQNTTRLSYVVEICDSHTTAN